MEFKLCNLPPWGVLLLLPGLVPAVGLGQPAIADQTTPGIAASSGASTNPPTSARAVDSTPWPVPDSSVSLSLETFVDPTEPLKIAAQPAAQTLEELHQEAALYHEKGHRRLEAYTLSRIASRLVRQEEDSAVAIAFYKRSLNLVESVRADLRQVERLGLKLGLQSPNLQGTLVDTFAEDIYRPLADLLLQQDRVWEAQQVLDLMHVQELDEYLQNVEVPAPQTRQGQIIGAASAKPAQPVSTLSAEDGILGDYAVLQRQAVALGKELSQLRQVDKDRRSPDQVNRIEELVKQQKSLSQQFNAFTRSPEVAAHVNELSRTSRQQNINLEDLNSLRDNLRQLDGAVLLYPLVLPDRLELILTTADAPPLRYTVKVTQQELEATIQEFRRDLIDPSKKPQKRGNQLYQWLVKPLEADLAAAGASTLIYAPDGPLRYMPLAALHDGEQWLVERFEVNHITARSLTDLSSKPQRNPSLLAAAFVEGSYSFDVGQRNIAFSGLPFAGLEVQALAAMMPGTDVFQDQAFTPEALVPAMDDYNIVHLATHATLVSGKPEDSFIVFGNGSTVSLREIETWSLPNVDLVVLSACETALGGALGDGTEILGLGYQIQRTGARAAIASLWQVNDGGTQQLMEAFYQQLNGPRLSKAKALRQAQLSMIRGEVQGGDGGDRGQFRFVPAEPAASSGEGVTSALSHPYYWAPFILIGNGL